MARIIGNASPGQISTGSGSGIDRRRSPFARLTIIAEEDGDVIRIPITALFAKFDQVFQGMFAQATAIAGGTVQIDVTLCEADLALNPIHDTPATGQQSHWHSDTTVAVGNGILKLASPIATALRITFAKKGTILYLAGV